MITLKKCPRCGKAFALVRSPVCVDCQPAEEADYEKIRDILLERDDLGTVELAAAAEVDVACVLRMLDQGYITNASVANPVRCGRCGAPAISVTKRLCQRCLNELNMNVSRTVTRLQKELADKRKAAYERRSRSQAFEVRRTVDRKRGSLPP